MPIGIEKKQNRYVEIFLIAFFIALSFLLPYMILDRGLFLFYGDYVVQQVPFYMLAHKAVRSGNIFWSFTTDLGSSFIPSYSFYLLGSPFFWLTLPFPDAAVPYLMGPLLALKMALMAVTSYAYIARFAKKTEFAAIGGLLYAFSGYTVYNIFFNHFLDPMVFFPLMLIALEEYMVNNRRGYFALTVFICAYVNYIFFFAQVIFIFIYWVVRLLSGDWVLTPKKFLWLAFESVVGVGLSTTLLIPSVIATSMNYRTRQFLSGWNLLIYDNNQRFWDILHSLFFPQDLPSRPNFFPSADNKWASMSAWLPMFSLSGALAFMLYKSRHWLKRLLAVALTMALIPGLNAAFQMFNLQYYARWFYMLVLFLSLATVMALEDPQVRLKKGVLWTAVITLAFALPIGLIPKYVNGRFVQIGLEEYPFKFWVYVLIAVLGLMILYLLVERFGKNTVAFANAATVALTIVVCIYANFFVATGKALGYDGNVFKSVSIEGASKLRLEGGEFFRVDVLNGMDNQAMFWGLPTIQAFQSTVSASILDFYPTIGVTRDVASRPNVAVDGIRPLFSVKYLFDPYHSSQLVMPGWSYYDDQLGFKIWKNDNFIPMGFTFDYYVTYNRYEIATNKDRLLLKALVLDDRQIEKYGGILQPFPYDNEQTSNSDATMAADCAQRRSGACSSFTTDNRGFSARITLAKPNLVFFSIPYDKGWTATVNGRPATVEKVDVGFMAVLCPAGTSSIRFDYMTPGLKEGVMTTAVSALLLILYLLLFGVFLRKKAAPAPYIPPAAYDENDENDEYVDEEETEVDGGSEQP